MPSKPPPSPSSASCLHSISRGPGDAGARGPLADSAARRHPRNRGATAAEALRRELQEEIGWQASGLTPWFSRTGELRLAEGQDMKLAELSSRLGERRPLALVLQLALEQLMVDGGAAEAGPRLIHR